MAIRKKTQRPTLVRDAARPPGGEIVIFQAPNGTVSLHARLDRDSIWLTREQMATLFGRDQSVVSRHLRNVFEEGELERAATVAVFASVQQEGSRVVTRDIEYFNLDVVISVGYRVHSKLGTQFRIWATGVLRDHVLRGYSVNRRRLSELNQAVRLISDVAKRRGLSGDEASALLEVVGEYSHALDLLDDYDHQRVSAPASGGKTVHIVEHHEAMRIVQRLRERFGGSELFGREKDNGLRSALGAVVQTFDGRDLYPSLEEKAAHLLYFLVKNHAFVDGNKRIGASLFLWFLERNGGLRDSVGERRISNAALVAMTLLIAASKPAEKDVIVRIVTHLLQGKAEPCRK